MAPALVDVNPDDPSVLIYPAQYRDCTLYTLTSESARPQPRVSFSPAGLPGKPITVSVGAGAAAMVLVDRRAGAVIAEYPPRASMSQS